ncbi:MAG TPA: hypothetical protein VFV49_04455 [Thermoanaerobaculia bacterium]|nr:hypothetical protein [Thermoanaerobaculia bacterium]
MTHAGRTPRADQLAPCNAGGRISMFRGKSVRIFFVVVAWFTIFPSEAFAYLDPGTGSLIVQSVIAALAAAGFGLRMYWGRIRTWVKRGDRSADSPTKRPPVGPA